MNENAVHAKLRIVRDDRILRVTIANPQRLNALDYTTMQTLGDVLIDAASDDSLRAIILTGEGAAFCTGADLSAAETQAASGITPDLIMDCANRLVMAIVNAPLPVIASVNGPAAGIGVGIALAADLVYVSEDTYFLLAFSNIGLMPDGGTTALIAAAAGRPLANEMALLGNRLLASDAKDARLVNAVVPASELNAKTQAAAEKLAHGPRRAIALTKHALNAASLAGLGAALGRENLARWNCSAPRTSSRVPQRCCRSARRCLPNDHTAAVFSTQPLDESGRHSRRDASR